jgi:Co/Zn/Cd efflux system component
MFKTSFHISKMDCPSEEQLIRMKLAELSSIHYLEFSILERKLVVYHESGAQEIFFQLQQLDLGTSLEVTQEVKSVPSSAKGEVKKEKKLLWTVLWVNLFFFALEMITGFIADSMGLIADSLDMLADTFVYGLALFAVGGTVILKKRVAVFAGILQILLAVLGFVEVFKRFFFAEEIPDYQLMIIISFFAFLGNGFCLYLLQKSKSQEAHMKASMIFTSNDLIINLGVILAGVLVMVTGAKLPDLIIGTIVFGVVFRGATQILRLAR